MSDNNKLSLVTSKNSNGISIMSNGEYSSLINLNSSNISGIFLEAGNSRPLRCSELNNKLTKRKYNLWNLKYISTRRDSNNIIEIDKDGDRDNLFIVKLINPFSNDYQVQSLIPKINTVRNISSTIGIDSSVYLNNTDNWPYTELEKETFKYDPSFRNNGWGNNYNSEIDRINLNYIGVGIVLIGRNSDIYTDTIDFRNIINYSRQPEIIACLDLEIGCTIEVSKSNYKSFTVVSKFTLFKYLENGQLKQDDFILDVNDDISIEFIDGVLRVIPSNSKITECIINNCILDYGKLN